MATPRPPAGFHSPVDESHAHGKTARPPLTPTQRCRATRPDPKPASETAAPAAATTIRRRIGTDWKSERLSRAGSDRASSDRHLAPPSLLRGDERVALAYRPSSSLAKKTAFREISRSIRSVAFSSRNRASSSRSSPESPPGRSPFAAFSSFSQLRNVMSEIPRSFASRRCGFVPPAETTGSPHDETPPDTAASFSAPDPSFPRLTTGSAQVSSKTGQVQALGHGFRSPSPEQPRDRGYCFGTPGTQSSSAVGAALAGRRARVLVEAAVSDG